MAQELFQPVLGGVNTPTYIAPGVVDKSKAMSIEATTGLIGAVGSQAIEAYKGYQIADLEREQEKVFKDYMEQGNAVRSAAADVQDQSIAMSLLPQDASEERISNQANLLQNSQMKLHNAMKQGRITPEEFNARILSNLREAINRNPGLEQELVNQTEKLLKYSGMGGFVKAQEQAMKSQQEQYDKTIDFLRTQTATLRIPTDYLNFDPVKANAAIQEVQYRKGILDTYQDLGSIQDEDTKSRARYFLLNNPGQVHASIVDGFHDQIFKNLQGLPQQDVPTMLATVARQKELAIREYDDKTSRILKLNPNDPGVKEMRDRFISSVEAAEKSWGDLATGKTAAEIYERQKSINHFFDEQQIRDAGMSPMLLNTLFTSPNLELLLKHGNTGLDTLKRVQGMAVDFVGNLTRPGSSAAFTQRPGRDGKSVADMVLGDVAYNLVKTPNDQNFTKAFENTLRSSNTLLRGDNSFTPQQKQTYRYSQLKELSNPSLAGLGKGVTSAGVAEFEGMANDFMKSHVAMMASVPEISSMKLDVLPDGRLSAVGLPPQMVTDLINPVNTALDAYANVHGVSREQAAATFYKRMFSQHLQYVAEDKDIMASKAQGQPTQTPANLVESYSQTPTADLQRNVTLLEQEIKKVPAAQRPVLENELAAINTVLQQRKGQYGTRPDGTAKQQPMSQEAISKRAELEGKYGRGKVPAREITANPSAFTPEEVSKAKRKISSASPMLKEIVGD